MNNFHKWFSSVFPLLSHVIPKPIVTTDVSAKYSFINICSYCPLGNVTFYFDDYFSVQNLFDLLNNLEN